MKIPYGIADFHRIRTEGYLYVDRTERIRTLEQTGPALLFLRPRRFGKSLWLRTLASYYDLLTTVAHERLFGDLAIGRDSTPLAHRYFVLEWDFSKIDPDPPPRGASAAVSSRASRLANELYGYLAASLETFLATYRDFLPEGFELGDNPYRDLDRLLAVIRQTPYRLYLLVDEYDNFANEVMTVDPDVYAELVHADAPFKRLFKWVKAAMGGGGLDRLFLTGVSPVVMSDLTSGLNIVENVYLYPELADLCGFTGEEVRALVEKLHAEKAASGMPTWKTEDALEMMREWYNGYRFAIEAEERVYNPTLVFYFLKHLQRTGRYPRQMLDANLAADEDKLKHIGQVAAGQAAVIEVIRDGKPLEVEQLVDRFTLRSMLDRSAQDSKFLGSYLYYFGMLTLEGETELSTLLLAPPNLVVKKLFADQALSFILPIADARSAARVPTRAILHGGPLEPLLDFIEQTIFPKFSNRDALWANELTVKTIFLTLLWSDVSHVMWSEPELDHRYADLCLLRRPDKRKPGVVDLLFELKHLSLGELGMTGEEVRTAMRQDLAQIPQVKKALDQAVAQLVAYRQALERRYGGAVEISAWAVAALGFERLVARPA